MWSLHQSAATAWLQPATWTVPERASPATAPANTALLPVSGLNPRLTIFMSLNLQLSGETDFPFVPDLTDWFSCYFAPHLTYKACIFFSLLLQQARPKLWLWMKLWSVPKTCPTSASAMRSLWTRTSAWRWTAYLRTGRALKAMLDIFFFIDEFVVVPCCSETEFCIFEFKEKGLNFKGKGPVNTEPFKAFLEHFFL